MATQKFTLKQTAQEVQDILDTATEITWEKEYSTEDFYDESLLNLSGAYYEQDERIKNVALTDAGYAYISATQCQ